MYMESCTLRTTSTMWNRPTNERQAMCKVRRTGKRKGKGRDRENRTAIETILMPITEWNVLLQIRSECCKMM